MKKGLSLTLVFFLFTVTILINGCGCHSCNVKLTYINQINSDDEYVYYKYHAFDPWYCREKCEPCRISSLEFWLEWEAWNYPLERDFVTKRPEAPTYEIMSRELTDSKAFVYTVRVKISDIMESIEKAKEN